ncbi:MAG: hypothetical protein HZB55_01280 [Deltaproteobacteria bacterium]|nr:hypothetical protein [Deltaproteobacteria bacterium]
MNRNLIVRSALCLAALLVQMALPPISLAAGPRQTKQKNAAGTSRATTKESPDGAGRTTKLEKMDFTTLIAKYVDGVKSIYAKLWDMKKGQYETQQQFLGRVEAEQELLVPALLDYYKDKARMYNISVPVVSVAYEPETGVATIVIKSDSFRIPGSKLHCGGAYMSYLQPAIVVRMDMSKEVPDSGVRDGNSFFVSMARDCNGVRPGIAVGHLDGNPYRFRLEQAAAIRLDVLNNKGVLEFTMELSSEPVKGCGIINDDKKCFVGLVDASQVPVPAVLLRKAVWRIGQDSIELFNGEGLRMSGNEENYACF